MSESELTNASTSVPRPSYNITYAPYISDYSATCRRPPPRSR